MKHIYLMGVDVWGSNASEKQYLNECLTSEKYKIGQWYCLENDGVLLSSLIIYRNCFGLEESFVGIGSVATVPAGRNKGFATKLIRKCIDNLTRVHYSGVYLFNDSSSGMYEKCGFRSISNIEGLMFLSIDGTAHKSIPTYF